MSVFVFACFTASLPPCFSASLCPGFFADGTPGGTTASASSHYSVLGVSPQATESEIKKAFHKLALQVDSASLPPLLRFADLRR